MQHDFWCETHEKQGYRKKPARAQARRLNSQANDGGRVRAYRCTTHDGLWHVGHIARDVIRGVLTVREYRQPGWWRKESGREE